MIKNPHFEQVCYSLTATGFQKIRHSTVRLTNGLSYHHRSYYEKVNYYDLMGSIGTIVKVQLFKYSFF